jgi:hypothetical protein
VAIPSETVAIPIIKGLDVTTDARLVTPPSLLEAINSRFAGGGAKKRRGHEGRYVRGEGAPLGLGVSATEGTAAYYNSIAAEVPYIAVNIVALQTGTVGNTYTFTLTADGTGAGSFTDGANLLAAVAGSAYMTISMSAQNGHSGILSGTATYTLDHGEDAEAANFPEWVFGVGLIETRTVSELDTDYWTSSPPDAAHLYGVATRDDETILWDGFRLFSYLPSQAGTQSGQFANVGNAVIPSLNAVSTAKHNRRQSLPQLADNGLTRLIVWIDDTEATRYTRYQIQDSTSKAIIAEGTFGVVNPKYIRAFTLENWMHAIVFDQDSDVVRMFSVVSHDPNTVVTRSLGEANGGHFDIYKCSDTLAMVVKSHDVQVHCLFLQSNGSGSPDWDPIIITPETSAAVTLVTCARATAGSNEFAVAWLSPGQHIAVQVMTNLGAPLFQGTYTSNVAATERITIAPKEAQSPYATDLWDLYWDRAAGDDYDLRRVRVWRDIGGVNFGTQRFRHGVRLASRAFRIGDRTFVWTGHDSEVQSQWLLLDEALNPVGRMEFGLANVEGEEGNLAGVNWTGSAASEYTLHLALSHVLRVEREEATSTVFTEPGIKAVYLDFLPSFRAVQAGRCLYIAGAQLWSYDGRELVEAGFHYGPEVTTEASNGGALELLGTYSYRVDVCYRNAQNEEVRSLSILTDSLELTGSQRTITLTIPSVVTRREHSYFLVYRNAMSAGTPLTNWWLLNSRDPGDASYLPNDQEATTTSYVDAGAISDTAIQLRETHPAGDTYLQPVSAPACEVVAAGRDRVWVAGGELLPGELAPSRLFSPGETVTFNAYLNIQVDRSNEPVTGIGFIGEVAAIFRPNTTYLLDSDGPDNNAQGYWNSPRLALADIGAVSQESIVRVVQGLLFQSSAGFRLLGPGGALNPIGAPVDNIARSFEVVGSVVIEKDQEARFYGNTQTLVYNYLYDTWSRWFVGGTGVAKDPVTGLALVARDDGWLWVEADDVWTDAGTTYTHRVRTAWLRGGQLGDFQRVRRVGGIGRFADTTNPAHNLRLEFYYDEREFWEDRHEWTLPDSTTNEDTWGAGTWGAGVWGDTSATISNLEDLTWDWERDPARQKCSSISIALEDYNTDGPGFELAAFTLELARKSGLNRGPTRTGTGSYR